MPVLVDDAPVLQAAELPDGLSQLAYFNALAIPREPFFHAGVDKLIQDLEALAMATGQGAPEPARLTEAPPAEAAAPAPARKFCTGCGSALRSGQRFCTGCGRKV